MEILEEINSAAGRHALVASLIASVFVHGGPDCEAVFDVLDAHELGLNGRLALEVGFRLLAMDNTPISTAARNALNICRECGPLALELAREIAEAKILEGPDGIFFNASWLDHLALALVGENHG